MSVNSLWKQTAAIDMSGDDLTENIDCDALIVGAGYTGLRCALALAEAGTDVIVVDTGDIGFGASGRNGGQVNPMLPVRHPDDLLKAVGKKYADRMTEMSLGSADEVF